MVPSPAQAAQLKEEQAAKLQATFAQKREGRDRIYGGIHVSSSLYTH